MIVIWEYLTVKKIIMKNYIWLINSFLNQSKKSLKDVKLVIYMKGTCSLEIILKKEEKAENEKKIT